MRYFVQLDFIETGPSLSPEALARMMEAQVLPSLETLQKLEADRRIVGGVAAGARSASFVLEARSNEEVGRLLHSLPFWGLVKAGVTPLESFKDRLTLDRESLEHLKAGSPKGGQP